MINKHYVCIVSNPTEPNIIDASVDFVCKTKEEIEQKIVVPLLNNHDMDEDPIGHVELVHIPIFTNKEGKEVCLVVGNVFTPYELANGTPISMGAPLMYRKGSVNFYDDILEVSVVGKAHVPSCSIYEGGALVEAIQTMKNDEARRALFRSILKSVGEIDG